MAGSHCRQKTYHEKHLHGWLKLRSSSVHRLVFAVMLKREYNMYAGNPVHQRHLSSVTIDEERQSIEQDSMNRPRLPLHECVKFQEDWHSDSWFTFLISSRYGCCPVRHNTLCPSLMSSVAANQWYAMLKETKFFLHFSGSKRPFCFCSSISMQESLFQNMHRLRKVVVILSEQNIIRFKRQCMELDHYCGQHHHADWFHGCKDSQAVEPGGLYDCRSLNNLLQPAYERRMAVTGGESVHRGIIVDVRRQYGKRPKPSEIIMKYVVAISF